MWRRWWRVHPASRRRTRRTLRTENRLSRLARLPLEVGVGEHEQLPHPGIASDDGDWNPAQLRDLRVELRVLMLRRQLVELCHRLRRQLQVLELVAEHALAQLVDTDESTTRGFGLPIAAALPTATATPLRLQEEPRAHPVCLERALPRVRVLARDRLGVVEDRVEEGGLLHSGLVAEVGVPIVLGDLVELRLHLQLALLAAVELHLGGPEALGSLGPFGPFGDEGVGDVGGGGEVRLLPPCHLDGVPRLDRLEPLHIPPLLVASLARILPDAFLGVLADEPELPEHRLIHREEARGERRAHRDEAEGALVRVGKGSIERRHAR